jgi:hypothetical protein
MSKLYFLVRETARAEVFIAVDVLEEMGEQVRVKSKETGQIETVQVSEVVWVECTERLVDNRGADTSLLGVSGTVQNIYHSTNQRTDSDASAKSRISSTTQTHGGSSGSGSSQGTLFVKDAREVRRQ